MTSVKSKLKTSVQAAKTQIGAKSAPDQVPKPKAKPKADHRLDAVLTPAGTPTASAGELFPARVWPD
jgi:hypothetical protein